MQTILKHVAVLSLFILFVTGIASGQVVTISGTGTTTISGTGSTEIVSRWLMMFGDSKTQLGSTATWTYPLARRGETLNGRIWFDDNVGVGGRTVATTLSAMPQMLSTMPAVPGATDIRVLINLGVNDITTTLPAEATWESNYLSIIDAIHTKWPTARVYLVRPWIRSFDADSDTVATRVGHLVAARPSFVFLGPDERIWLKGADNGSTMTTDGTHYSVAGNLEVVNQWAAVLFP